MRTDHPINWFLAAGTEALPVLTGGLTSTGPDRVTSLTLKSLERRIDGRFEPLGHRGKVRLVEFYGQSVPTGWCNLLTKFGRYGERDLVGVGVCVTRHHIPPWPTGAATSPALPRVVALDQVLPGWLASEPDNPYLATLAPLVLTDEAEPKAGCGVVAAGATGTASRTGPRLAVTALVLRAKEVWRRSGILTPIQATMAWQSIFAEGKQEGSAEGRARGLAEGKAEGLAEGKAEGLIRLLTRRFGPVPTWAAARIAAAPPRRQWPSSTPGWTRRPWRTCRGHRPTAERAAPGPATAGQWQRGPRSCRNPNSPAPSHGRTGRNRRTRGSCRWVPSRWRTAAPASVAAEAPARGCPPGDPLGRLRLNLSCHRRAETSLRPITAGGTMTGRSEASHIGGRVQPPRPPAAPGQGSGRRHSRAPRLAVALLAALAGAAAPAQAADEDPALYSFDDRPRAELLEYPDWFNQSFLDLRDDLAAANRAGRTLVLYFGQKRCAYCHQLFRVNFARPDITEYARRHFAITPIDIWGTEELTTLDGSVLTEQAFTRQVRADFTPSLVFLDAAGQEVFRLRGYYPPYQFRAALEYVADQHYERESFRDFLARGENRMVFDETDLNDQPFFSPPPYMLDRSRVPAERPLVVFFEQGDCHACDVLHGQTLADIRIADRFADFDAVQLDIHADTPVVTPDGSRTTAREWAARLGLFYTPSLLFFDERGRELLRVDSVVAFYRLSGVLDYLITGAYRDEPDYQRWSLLRAPRGL